MVITRLLFQLLILALAWGGAVGKAAPDIPDQGCFWVGECLNSWVSGCGRHRKGVATSADCGGLCPAPAYPACSSFTTHIKCCSQDDPRETDTCGHCPSSSRLDTPDRWLCCTDCQRPAITDRDAERGYCPSGGVFSFTAKPKERDMWSVGGWSGCSAVCGSGVRDRKVACTGQLGAKVWEVEESKCAGKAKPASQEVCNSHPCQGSSGGGARGRLSGWTVVLWCFLALCIVGGGAMAAFVFYERRRRERESYMYIMMDAYA